MKTVSENISLEWVSIYCLQIVEQSLVTSVARLSRQGWPNTGQGSLGS